VVESPDFSPVEDVNEATLTEVPEEKKEPGMPMHE